MIHDSSQTALSAASNFLQLPPQPQFNFFLSAIASQANSYFRFAEMAALAATAAAAQDGFVIQSPLGGIKPIGLLFCLSAPSGTRKSTTLRLAMQPIHDHERSKLNLEKEELARYDREIAAFKARERKLLNKIAGAEDAELQELQSKYERLHSEKPEIPKTYRRLASNSTIEGLLKRYEESRYSPFLEADEGRHAMTLLMNEQSPQLCKLYDGDSISTVRASAKSHSIDAPRLSAIFMLQPEILSDYVAKHGHKSLGSGLWARILAYQLDAAQQTLPGCLAQPQRLAEFHQRIQEILDYTDRVVTGEVPARTLQFTPEAAGHWHFFSQQCDRRRQDNSSFADSTHAYIARAPENMLRLAGLLHLLDTGGTTPVIPARTVEVASQLMSFYIEEHIRLFEHGALDPDIMDDQKLLAQIRAKIFPNQRATKSHIHAIAPRSFRGKGARLNASLERLVTQGFIYKGYGFNYQGRKPVDTYTWS